MQYNQNQEIFMATENINYEISIFGRVRNAKTGKILKPSPMGSGYPDVSLSLDGKKTNHKIHQLVAKAFIENPHGYPSVDHIEIRTIITIKTLDGRLVICRSEIRDNFEKYIWNRRNKV